MKIKKKRKGFKNIIFFQLLNLLYPFPSLSLFKFPFHPEYSLASGCRTKVAKMSNFSLFSETIFQNICVKFPKNLRNKIFMKFPSNLTKFFPTLCRTVTNRIHSSLFIDSYQTSSPINFIRFSS